MWSLTDDAALAFITEPPGLRFVVVNLQRLDAVQCGVASEARPGPPWTRIERRSRSRCRDAMNLCPIFGQQVRYSEIIYILDEKASLDSDACKTWFRSRHVRELGAPLRK